MTFENDNSLIELEQIRKREQDNLTALDALSEQRDAEWTEWARLAEIRQKSLEILDALDGIGERSVKN